jgi:alkylation response protein AidB-like acyl-CoA dehydrogenase
VQAPIKDDGGEPVLQEMWHTRKACSGTRGWYIRFMNFEFSAKTKDLQQRLQIFMDAYVYPNEQRFHEEIARERWKPAQVIEELKAKARDQGLWNLFLPKHENGTGLTNLEYAPLCEIMGRSHIAPEVFNCSAPDTGNRTVFGYDHAPHGHAEIHFDNVRVPATNILFGEGRGFEIVQGRLGPGRIHHSMRCMGSQSGPLQPCATECNRAWLSAGRWPSRA